MRGIRRAPILGWTSARGDVLYCVISRKIRREGQGYTVQTAPGYIDAVRKAFVYEDAGKLILGQGLAPEWFDQGIEVKDMPTLYGKICYVIKKEGNVIRYFIYGAAKPPKGVKFVLPKELSNCKIEEMKAKQ